MVNSTIPEIKANDNMVTVPKWGFISEILHHVFFIGKYQVKYMRLSAWAIPSRVGHMLIQVAPINCVNEGM